MRLFGRFLVLGALANAAAGADDSAERLFVRRILPLLDEKCLACHGKDEAKIKGGLDLRTRVEVLAGGDSGKPAIVPGRPEQSPLYLAATRAHDDEWKAMPPKENDALSAEQIGDLKRWIAAGAPWPEGSRREALSQAAEPGSASEGVQVKTDTALSAEWQNRRYDPAALWAYRPVTRPLVPVIGIRRTAVTSEEAVISNPRPETGRRAPTRGGTASPVTDHRALMSAVNPVDAFIHARLAAVGLDPAPAADPRTFIRRATFDLTGLPPTPEDVTAFESDSIRDPQSAIRNLIDRLLASPHYGERQAQHWLDVTRYADTSGFSNDYERPGVWRYRDYVVRSFNADKRFDQFVREQLAGDLIDPENPEMVVAAGFLRMGPWEATAMNSPEVTRQQFLDDVVNHVGEVFLAQPLRCAKCHDHKFDPIPTRDYYRMMAVFGATHPAEREMPFTDREVKPDGRQQRERANREIAKAVVEMDALGRKHFDAGIAWLQEKGRDTTGIKFRGGGYFNTFNSFFGDLPEEQRPPRNFGLTPDEITRLANLAKSRAYLKREIDRYEPVAFTVYDGAPNAYSSNKERNPVAKAADKRVSPPIHILAGGNIDAAGEAVPPGVLSGVTALSGLTAPTAENEPARIGLARWISDDRNPLTARVIVNRVWQQHFGRGLVATPNNFGRMGARPTHPELLDFLAAWLVEHHWSLKQLHRLIVTSETYSRSARHPDPEAVRKADPGGELVAAFPVRRLGAEEMRDAMLALSGELSPAMGGPPVFPEMNLEAALQPRYVMSGVAPAYQPSPQREDRHRRTLYSCRLRGLPDPLLEVFNRPNADLSCERRDATTVTPQVFALLNGQVPNQRALAFARRLENEAPAPRDRITRAYRLAYGRSPSSAEIDRAMLRIGDLTELHRSNPVAPVPLPTKVRRSMVGEMTGAVSEWDEILDVYTGSFVPDIQPWDVGPETRALAAFCLVLFNSNEFLYLE